MESTGTDDSVHSKTYSDRALLFAGTLYAALLVLGGGSTFGAVRSRRRFGAELARGNGCKAFAVRRSASSSGGRGVSDTGCDAPYDPSRRGTRGDIISSPRWRNKPDETERVLSDLGSLFRPTGRTDVCRACRFGVETSGFIVAGRPFFGTRRRKGEIPPTKIAGFCWLLQYLCGGCRTDTETQKLRPCGSPVR